MKKKHVWSYKKINEYKLTFKYLWRSTAVNKKIYFYSQVC